jgi:proteasome lid subunit RPN8/RPN11
VIVLPESLRDALVERARAGAPDEVCGVLGGTFDREGTSRVASQYPTRNAAATPRTRYRIDPEEQLETFERLEDRGEEIVGFYHSHPRGPAEPSVTDAAQATWPDRSYVVVTPANGGRTLESGAVLGSWRWREDEDEFDREAVDVV